MRVRGKNGFLSVTLIFIVNNADWKIMKIMKEVFS